MKFYPLPKASLSSMAICCFCFPWYSLSQSTCGQRLVSHGAYARAELEEDRRLIERVTGEIKSGQFSSSPLFGGIEGT
jgi:hypothetical protein